MPYALHELGTVPHHHGGLVGAGLCIGAGGRFQSRQSHGADPDLGQPRVGASALVGQLFGVTL